MSAHKWAKVSRRALLGAAAAGSVGIALGGCTKVAQPGSGGSLLDTIKQRGHALIGVANELPYSFAQTDGTIIGVEPELAIAALKGLGITEVKPVVGAFASMIPGLQAGQMDMVTAALFINKSRCESVIFAEPDSIANDSFAVLPNNPDKIVSLEDAKARNLKVSVIASTAISEVAKRYLDSSNIIVVDDHIAGTDALKAKRVNAHLGPTLTLHELNKKAPDAFSIVTPVPESPATGGAIAFRQTDTSFRDQFNAEIVKLKSDGTFDQILTKYGFDPALSREAKVDDLCKL